MQNGGFQNHSLMRLTLLLTLILVTGFWATNFAIYFSKMDLTPASVQDYYLGSEANYTLPKTYQSMLEVTHAHLAMIAFVVLLLTHLLIFAPHQFRTKVMMIVGAFTFALLNEGSGWLTRFVHPEFAWMKLFAFTGFQFTLGFLIFSLALFLWKGYDTKKSMSKSENGHPSPRRESQRVKQNESV